MIALLGRDPGATDGVRDYCEHLGEALRPLGHDLRIGRVAWDRGGRLAALRCLWRLLRANGRDWCLLQYTAYAWSRSGIPLLAAVVATVVRLTGGRLATVFHDSVPHEAPGLAGFVRRNGQKVVMRSLYRLSDTSIVTIPREAAPWLPDTKKAVTIPVGSNVAPPGHRPTQTAPRARPPLVAVFGVTGGTSRDNEVRLIAKTVAMVREAVPDITLVFFGCGTPEAAPLIQERVACRFEVKGLLSSDEAHRLLESASAVLFVRGAVASGRTTAVSGIVAGTPVVGFLGPTTGPPITAAGVWLVQRDAPEVLADALRTMLTDEAVWAEMHQRNVLATAEHFSWTAIAERMARALAT